MSFLKKLFRIPVKAAKYTAITLGAGIPLLYYFQGYLLYLPQFPNKIPHTNPPGSRHPGEAHLAYEDIHITTPDGVKLHGWFIPNESSKTSPTIVVFQGRGGNIGHRVPFLAALNKYCNANLLIIAYRGYSYSEGHPTEKGVQTDAVATMDYLFSRDDIDPNKVFVLGSSMGGAVAIYAVTAKEYKIKGLVLENTFTAMKDMVSVKYPYFAIFAPYILTNHWESIKKIWRIQAPILFISGLKDELIPQIQMKTLYEKATSSKFKEWVDIEEGTHNETWSLGEAKYFRELKIFMDRALALNATNSEQTNK